MLPFPSIPVGSQVTVLSRQFTYEGRQIARAGQMGRVTGFRNQRGRTWTAVVRFAGGETAEINVCALKLVADRSRGKGTATGELSSPKELPMNATRAQRTLARASLLSAARERLHTGVALNITHLANEFSVTPVTARKWLADAGFDLSGLRRGRPKSAKTSSEG